MIVNIIRTNTVNKGREKLFEFTKENREKSKRTQVYITSDRNQLSLELFICKEFEKNGILDISVYSFNRFVAQMIGTRNKKSLSREGIILLMNKVIKENQGNLKYYTNVNSIPFTKQIVDAINRLRGSAIEQSVLESQLERLKNVENNQGLYKKIYDINYLYKKYNEEIEMYGFDTHTRFEWFNKNADDIQDLKEMDVYISGFPFFSTLQLNVIKTLIKYCNSVNIVLGVNKKATNNVLFTTEQLNDIEVYCKKEFGTFPNYIDIGEETLQEPFESIHKQMFGFNSSKKEIVHNENDSIKICEYNNIFDEIKAVGKEISYLVFNKDKRYRDFAIVCDNEDYKPIIKQIFDRMDIPVYVDAKYFLDKSFYGSLIKCILSVADNNYELTETLKLLRHPYISTENTKIEKAIRRDDIQKYENYCIKFNILNSLPKIEADVDSKLENLKENNELILKKDDPLYGSIKKVVDLVQSIISPLKEINTVKGYSEYLLNLRTSNVLNIVDFDIMYSEKQKEDKNIEIYGDRRKVIDILNQMKDIIGDSNISLHDYLLMVSSIINNITISDIPSSADSVFLGDSRDSVFEKVDYMFIVGASEGFFPCVKGEDPVLRISDINIIKDKCGIQVRPTPQEENDLAKYTLVNTLSKIKEKGTLYISYAKEYIDGTKPGVSTGILELSSLLDNYANGQKQKRFIEYHNFNEEEKLLYNMVNFKNCYYEYKLKEIPEEYEEAVKKYLLKNKELLDGRGIEFDYSIKEDPIDLTQAYEPIDGNPNSRKISVSKLETYFTCPFKNYLKNCLKIEPRETNKLEVKDYGNFIHDVLFNFFNDNKKVIRTIEKEELNNAIDKAIAKTYNKDEYHKYNVDIVTQLDLDYLKDELRQDINVLVDHVKHSSFDPKFLEKYFSAQDDNTLKINVNGQEYIFTGRVDRVDVYDDGKQKYVNIIDYKTGRVEPGLKNVYYGKKIQLYVYLIVYMNGGYKPAGVFYLKIPKDMDVSNYKLDGQLLAFGENPYEILSRFDDKATNCNYSSDIIDLALKPNGNFTYQPKTRKALSEREFGKLTKYVEELIKQALSEQQKGYAEKKPLDYDDACKYCDYQSICGDNIIQRKSNSKMNSIDVFDVLGSEQ